MKYLLLIITTLYLVIATVGCGKSNEKNNNSVISEDTITVEIQKLETVDYTVYGTYYGKISPIQTATLLSTSGGRVDKIKTSEGRRVSAGASLGSVESEKAVALLEMAKLAENIAKGAYERSERQFKKENVSKVMVDKAKLDWLNTKNALVDAKKMWRGALCVSPINGTVTARYINMNQELSPGSPTFTVSQLYKMRIGFGIPENEIFGVNEGNEATVTIDAYPDRKWVGKVSRLWREISSGTRVFPAEVIIDNKDKIIKAGITAKVKIVREKFLDIITVPSNLLITLKDEKFVMIAINSRAIMQEIKTGYSDEKTTVVLDGLDAGDLLISKGSQLVSDGTVITFSSGKE